MLRLPIVGRAVCLSQAQTKVSSTPSILKRGNSGSAPEKIECFVDGKKVLVDPGTTVLQVY